MAKTKENKAKDTKNTKDTKDSKESITTIKVQPYYTYVLSGGAIKSGICVVGKGYAHPESELEKYKPFYGNDVKGYYTKTTKSPKLIENELNKALSDNKINDILYKGYVNGIKNILKVASEVTNCTSMNVYAVVKKAESDNDEPDEEAQSDNDEQEEEVIVQTKKTKNSKAKETKPKKEEKVAKKETKKPAKETKKSTKKIKKVSEDSDSDSDDEVNNKTSIILSDESESESEVEEA